MQNIEFDENKELQGQAVSNSEAQSFMMWLLAKAGVTDKTTANSILLSIAAIGFGVTIFIYAGMFNEQKKDLSLDARALINMGVSRQ